MKQAPFPVSDFSLSDSSEEAFRLLFVHHPIPMFLYDLETLMFVEANQAALDKYGYTLEEFRRLSVRDIRPKEDIPAFLREVVKMNSEVRYLGEWRHCLKNGRIIQVQINSSAMSHQGRKVVLTFVQDITERKQAEKLLAGENAVMELIATASPLSQILESIALNIENQSEGIVCSILLVRDDGKFLVNGAAPHLSPEYIRAVEQVPIGPAAGSCGTAVYRRETVVVSDIARDPLWKDYKHLAEAEGVASCWSSPVIDSDGKVLATFALYSIEPRQPEPRHFELIARAAHQVKIALEQSRAVEEIRRSSARFVQTLDNMLEGCMMIGHDWTFLYTNDAGARHARRTREELVGHKFLEAVPEAAESEAYAAYRRCMEQRTHQSLETQFTFAGGRQSWFVLSVEPIAEGIFVLSLEITERKLAEEAKKSLEAQLFQTQKLESLGTLASGIAHDFNNLLSIILGHATLLESVPQDHVSLNRNVGIIKKASLRGAALVKQMLTFARRSEPVMTLVHLNSLVAETVRLLGETFPKTIRVVLQLGKDLPAIPADSNQIHQVLLNLCINARDAMPKGGTLTLSTRLESGRILAEEHPGAALNSYLVVKVEDTGEGMDQETLSRVFEPFFTTKERGKGTGLGLSVVFGIMESHGGFVLARSSPGQGTVFECAFPVERETLDLVSSVVETVRARPQGNETLLFVEDEEMLRDMVKAFLEAKGYSVLTAEDGERGLALYREHRKEIGLVISDLGMPKFGGEELHRRLKEMDPHLRMVFVSGTLEPASLPELERGTYEFVQKPFHLEALLKAVQDLLDR